MTKPIISPVERELLIAELATVEKLRDTRHGNNEIYIFDAATAPNLMREVGRLREKAFRSGGGGTGNELDIDADDTAADGYHQLIAWDPSTQEVIGGYRYIICTTPDQKHLSTEHYFRFSQKFRDNYLSNTLELGRAFVSPEIEMIKGVYALDNLWDGIGALIKLNNRIKFLLGKVTMYSSYNLEARDMLFYFLRKHYPGSEGLVEGLDPITMDIDNEKYGAIFTGENFAEDYKILRTRIRDYNEVIPPMFNAYINITNAMHIFDSVHNHELGDVYETGILVPVATIHTDKYERYTTW